MRHGGTIEEVSDDRFDGDMLHSVVLPLMADRRIAMCGSVDPYEIHKTETYLTTRAHDNLLFKKMWEILVSMVKGESAFVLGSSFELPCMHDQLDLNFIIEQKNHLTSTQCLFKENMKVYGLAVLPIHWYL